MNENPVYASPRAIASVDQCSFYHTIDIPQTGTVEGLFDLRGVEKRYLGYVNFAGKRVLEVGPASGFLSFYMERQGADVVALDLDEHHKWDVVPYASIDYEKWQEERKEGLRLLNNSFWYCHQRLKSRVKVIYGSVYSIPKQIGRVDISVLSCVLLHLRDPFLALHHVLAMTNDTVIITETFYPHFALGALAEFTARIGIRLPICTFIPKVRRPQMGTWWWLSPEAIRQFLSVLGFAHHRTIYHAGARHKGRRQLMYTVVGQRTTQTNH